MKIEIKNSDLIFYLILVGIVIISSYLIVLNLNNESIIMIEGHCYDVNGNNVTIGYATYFFINYFDDDIIINEYVKITARVYEDKLLFINRLELIN